MAFWQLNVKKQNICTYTVSHKYEYTPHISAVNLVYLFKGQYYRNETWIYFRVVNVQPLKITQHTAIIVKKDGNKTEYTLSDNSYTLFNHAKPDVLFIMFMFYLLNVQICVSCFRAVTILFFEYNSIILTAGCSTWHLMAKNSLRIWELKLLLSTKMARGYKKFGNSLELSYSTVARVIQKFSKMGFIWNRPRKGR